MQRRILVNFRVEPDILSRALPAPFRPALVHGYGVAGICLIRLANIRPVHFPAVVGLTSENAAHRVAVEWDTPDGPVTGAYVPRRDTSSGLAAVAGGRLFPGRQHAAGFDVHERDGIYSVEVVSRDGVIHIAVAASVAESVMAGSLFPSVEEASRFFRCAPIGYTPTQTEGVFDAVELRTEGWGIQPLQVEVARSSYFEDAPRFSRGSVVVDSAFLMGDLHTTWQPRLQLVATATRGPHIQGRPGERFIPTPGGDTHPAAAK